MAAKAVNQQTSLWRIYNPPPGSMRICNPTSFKISFFCIHLSTAPHQQAMIQKPIHPDFLYLLEFKEAELIVLFKDLREYILEIYPEANELLYHTHALTTVFSLSDKLSDAFCMLPIYSKHLNLGFNKGSKLHDPHGLLTGTGNLIRHIDVTKPADYRNKKAKDLIQAAVDFAIKDMEKPSKFKGNSFSKIKK